MKLTNYQIYQYTNNLINWKTDQRMPVKINFFLQKNINIIVQAGREIEEAKMQIAQHFGTLNENMSAYSIPQDKQAQAAAEIQDLFSLEQELPIHIFKLEDFENIELTMEQLSAIMFMIEE